VKETVNVGRANVLRPEGAVIAAAEVIGEDDEDVWFERRRGIRGGDARERPETHCGQHNNDPVEVIYRPRHPHCVTEIGRQHAAKTLTNYKMVPTTGLEPVRCYSLEPESSASANSATWAN
jgi:hypothetical protein